MVTLSIIVPVYNTQKYLSKCLDSLLNQTRRDFEIIIINDGSTDQSENILDKYEKEFPEILKVITQENHGIGYTRNQGIKIAKGKYITFIDSDDALELNYCQQMLDKMEQDNLDLVVCDYYEVDELTGEKKYFRISEFADTDLTKEPRLLFDINISPWNKLYKTEIIREYNLEFPEKLKYEDTIFVLKYFAVAKKIGKVNEALVDYLIRGGGETKTMNIKIFDIFVILEEIYKFFVKIGLYDKVKEYYEWFCINRITVYSIQQRYQPDLKDGIRFINQGYDFLDHNFINWKNNPYYKEKNSILKRILKSNRFIMKTFVSLTRKGQ